MAITVKHSGNAAPFAAGAFAGSAKRGVPQMQIPAWGSGSSASSSTSRRGRRKKTYNELLEEGLTTKPAVTTATQAGFTGPTPVGAQRPNSVASQAGFAVAHNLDGTVNLTPQEIAANAMKAAGVSGGRSGGKYPRIDTTKPRTIYDENGNLVKTFNGSGVAPVATTSAQPTQALGKTWTDDKGNVWTNDSKGVPKVALKDAQDPLDAARLERSEYDYKQRMERSKFDYENTPLVDRQNPPKLVTSYGVEQNAQLDKLNRSYDDAVNSGKYSKSELIQLKNHVDYEKSKIRPSERFETTMPWDEQREPDTPRDTSKDPGKMWIEHGAMFSRDEKGMPVKLGDVKEDPSAVQAKEDAKAAKAEKKAARAEYISMYNEAAKLKVTDKSGVERPMNAKEISKYVSDRYKEIERSLNPQSVTATPHAALVAHGKKVMTSVSPKSVYASAEKVAAETGLGVQDVFSRARSILLSDTHGGTQIDEALLEANTPYEVMKILAESPIQESPNAPVASPATETPAVQSTTPIPTYAPATSPKDFKENTGLTIGEIGQALKSRGNLKDSRLDFKGIDPQRRAEIEQENKDLAELAQMTPVELYNMAAQQANEKQTSVAEQLRIVRDYISGR